MPVTQMHLVRSFSAGQPRTHCTDVQRADGWLMVATWLTRSGTLLLAVLVRLCGISHSNLNDALLVVPARSRAPLHPIVVLFFSRWIIPVVVCFFPVSAALRSDSPCLTVFGRDTAVCDIFVGHASVSRQHAFLCWHHGICYACPFETPSGTKVNGELLRYGELRPLAVGDALVCGKSARKYVLKLDADGRIAAATAAARPGGGGRSTFPTKGL